MAALASLLLTGPTDVAGSQDGTAIVLHLGDDATVLEHDTQIAWHVNGNNIVHPSVTTSWVSSYIGEPGVLGGMIVLDLAAGSVSGEITEQWRCLFGDTGCGDYTFRHADLSATITDGQMAPDGDGWSLLGTVLISYRAAGEWEESPSNCGGVECYICENRFCTFDRAMSSAAEFTGRYEDSTLTLSFADGLTADPADTDVSSMSGIEYFLSRFSATIDVPPSVAADSTDTAQDPGQVDAAEVPGVVPGQTDESVGPEVSDDRASTPSIPESTEAGSGETDTNPDSPGSGDADSALNTNRATATTIAAAAAAAVAAVAARSGNGPSVDPSVFSSEPHETPAGEHSPGSKPDEKSGAGSAFVPGVETPGSSTGLDDLAARATAEAQATAAANVAAAAAAMRPRPPDEDEPELDPALFPTEPGEWWFVDPPDEVEASLPPVLDHHDDRSIHSKATRQRRWERRVWGPNLLGRALLDDRAAERNRRLRRLSLIEERAEILNAAPAFARDERGNAVVLHCLHPSVFRGGIRRELRRTFDERRAAQGLPALTRHQIVEYRQWVNRWYSWLRRDYARPRLYKRAGTVGRMKDGKPAQFTAATGGRA